MTMLETSPAKKEYAYTTGALGEALDTIIYTYGDSEWGDLLTGFRAIVMP